MCVTTFDALNLPGYTCSLADGTPLDASSSPAPIIPERRRRRAQALTWEQVAAGTMLVNGIMRPNAGGRPGLERTLILRARDSWMPLAHGLDLLFMTSCAAAGDARSPTWWRPIRPGLPMPLVHWHCFQGQDRLGVSLWRKTGALLAALHAMFPHKEYYLKLDSDTLVMPHALVRFLRALHAADSRGRGRYFGSNRISQKALFGLRRGGLLSSNGWLALERSEEARLAANGTGRWAHAPLSAHDRRQLAHSEARSMAMEERCESAVPSYAQGGAYGFDRRALGLLAGGDCLEGAYMALSQHTGRRSPALFEDEAVGLCMRLYRMRLVTCGCFYDWGPCDITHPESCRADTNESRLCRLPLTVHKLRQVSWFDGWWRMLSNREAAHLAEVDQWAPSSARAQGHSF